MRRFLIACSLIMLVMVAAASAWRHWPESHSFYTDAASIKEPVSTAVLRDILWQPPVALAEVINTGEDDYEPKLSADGLTLFFVRGKAGHDADIYFSRRTYEGWTPPEPLHEVNSKADDLGAEPTADGVSLYFYSNRDGGQGGYDLWVSRRGRDGWQEPMNLGPTVNSEFNDYGPALTNDGGMLYFSSNRPRPGDSTGSNPNAWPATLREDFYRRTYDLYHATITDHGVAEATALAALNTPYNEGAPAVSPFGDFIYFASDRPGGLGGFDLYRSRRLRGEQVPPLNLGVVVNTPANELDPALAMGGYALYFSSDRPTLRTPSASAGSSPAPREYNLYQSTSREVFTEVNTIARPPINWAAIWTAIGPNLLWALLALLLLLLMLALFRSAQNRKLSLLAKCLLGSLAVHLLLMVLFNVWDVAASIAGEISRSGRGLIQIALVGPASGDALAAQIRGQGIDLKTPSPIEHQSERLDTRLNVQWEQSPVRTTVERSAMSPNENPEMSPALADAQPKFLLAALPRAFVKVPAPPPFETALPAETALPRGTEAEAAAHPAHVEPSRPGRSAASDPVSLAEIAPTQIAMQPAEADRSLALSASQTLIESITPQDASPRHSAVYAPQLPGPDGVPVPAAQVASSLTLVLPAAPPDSMPGLEELQPRIEVPVSMTPVRAASPAAVVSLIKNAGVSMAPKALRSVANDSSLASDLDIHTVEAATRAPVKVATGNASSVPTHPPTANVALPVLEIRGFVAASEASAPTPVAAVHPRRARPAMNDLKPDLSSGAGVSMAPQTALAGFNEQSVSLIDMSPVERDAVPRRSGGVASLATSDIRAVPEALKLGLSMPTQELAPENPYVQRFSEQRMEFVERMGGSKETEQSVALALQWLAAHQSKDGHWDADGFDRDCGECGGVTNIAADNALTGLSLLCFLGAGHTHTKAGLYRDHVERGLQWLAGRQKPDGDLRGEETMYSHGIAAIALSEAYALTADPKLSNLVQRAARFIQRVRNREVGGWRYDPGQPGDTSVLGWQVMALKSASMAGVEVSPDAFGAAREWLDRVSERKRPGLYSYQPGQPPTPSMTAEGMFAQLLMGLQPSHPRIQDSVDFILQHLPSWESDPSTYFWYYASLALFQHQGKAWEAWNEALTKELTSHQRTDGRAAGSWDPADEWSKIGGRVYQTALCTLMLEVYYRYLPLYALDPSSAPPLPDGDDESPSIGTIRGVVTDAVTRRPLAGAAVQLDLPDGEPVTSFTEHDGAYMLDAPEVPDFFALSASRKGFIPKSANVERARVEGRTLTVDFTLEPASSTVVVTEAVPDVHHLGDNQFDGTINSQFQKKSEGAQFAVEFDLSNDPATENLTRAEVRLLAKGVQRNHRVVVNGTTLKRRLNQAPEDGSFGEFVAPFPATLLQIGANTLQIIAAPSESDIDDFEFVNVQIRLSP